MERQHYSTDLTDAQWKRLEPFFPPVNRADGRNGRPRKYPYREILNGIFYITRAGCVWSLMPHDLPPWLLCHKYFSLWSKSGRVRINGVAAGARDGIAVTGESRIEIAAEEDAELVLVDAG